MFVPTSNLLSDSFASCSVILRNRIVNLSDSTRHDFTGEVSLVTPAHLPLRASIAAFKSSNDTDLSYCAVTARAQGVLSGSSTVTAFGYILFASGALSSPSFEQTSDTQPTPI